MIPLGLSIAQLAAQNLLPSPIAFFRARAIGPFVANVTLEEHHTDEVQITDHPVERNAVISDHAFKRPAMVTIKVGYSNSNLQALGNPSYVQNVYQQFLELQESREPFTILTGKRMYTNMLITRLVTTTDEKTENALMLTVECREVIIVTTTVVTTSSPDVQKSPQATAGIQTEGTKQAIPTPSTFDEAAFAQAVPTAPQGSAAFEIPISATPLGTFGANGVTPLSLGSIGAP